LQEDEENDIMRNIIVFSASNDEVKDEIKEACSVQVVENVKNTSKRIKV
jgi:hypothetical protein